MFAGYEGLVTYYVDHDSFQSDSVEEETYNIPPEYLPYEPSADPWFQSSTCPGDFLLLAEGSELEGPIPLITIPKHESMKFNVDEFVVRIMSVDHQITSGSAFSISEDVQVFVTQMENGVYAYVHYFTLYDVLARGFVRPFCLAYITPDYSKLMDMSRELMLEFARVSECFKSGNRLVFFQDMAHTLSDLQFTRERFLECQLDLDLGNVDSSDGTSCMNDSGDGKALRSLHLHELDAAIAEVKSILQKLNELFERTDEDTGGHRPCSNNFTVLSETPLDSNNFKTTRSLNADCDSEPKSQCLHPPGTCSDATCHILNDLCESYQPKLKTNLKPMIQKSLRSIHELCHNRAKQGLDYLYNIYKYFKRDTASLLLEKEDCSVLDPACSVLTIGRMVYLNFLTGFHRSRYADGVCPIVSPKTCSVVCSPTGAIDHKWHSNDTLASFYSCESLSSFASCPDETETTPETTAQTTPETTKATFAAPNGHSCKTEMLPSVATNIPPNAFKPDVEMKTMHFKDHVVRDLSPDSTSDQTLKRPKSLNLVPTSSVKPTPVSVISVSDHILNLKETSYGIGFGILQFVRQYSFAVHLIYSLLCGRPVVIIGSVFQEKEIHDLVTALWILLPGHSSSSCSVLPWSTVPLILSDLKNLKLCGLGKPDKKSYDWMIPKNLKSYVTVFYFDRKSLWGPTYKGGILNEVVESNENFDCDGSYISYIHSKLFQLALKSFSFYHGFCMRKSAAFYEKLEEVPRQEAWKETSRAIAKKLNLTHSDHKIVEYLSEVVVHQQAEETSRCHKGEVPPSISLDCQTCSHHT